MEKKLVGWLAAIGVAVSFGRSWNEGLLAAMAGGTMMPSCTVAVLSAFNIPNVTIRSATDVAASGLNPEYCEVVGSVATDGGGAGPGEATFRAKLPLNWNHKLSAATAIIGYGAQEQDLSTSDSAVRGYQVISHTRDESIVNPLRKWDTVVEVNGDSRERFIMHRVYMPSNHKRGAIILLPALAFRFETYMFDESGDPMNSLAAELALAGYDVYGYSFRNTFVPPRGCSTGAFDCSVMAHWGWAESWLPDIEYIRQNVKGNVKPAIGGISRGAALAIAAINQNPNAYSGLLAWDVMLYSENPRIIGINTFACNSLTAAVNNGVYANEAIGNLKIIVPLNIFAAMNVFSTPGPQFTGNFIQLVANATRTGFQFADYERVKAIIATTTDVEPIAGTRDGVCSMKGDRTFTGNLASFSGPILAFEEEFGFGPYMQDTINLTSSTNVRLVFNPGEGHLDSWMSPDHVAKIDSVIIDWLDNDVFPEQRLRR